MREIMFRGKSMTWHYGDLIHDSCNGRELIFIDDNIERTRHSVDKDTVGQYTGLKDREGREIYEGDVIKLDEEIYAVTWNDYSGCWSVEFGGMGLALLTQYSTKDSIVIGNIHDNPELLTQN